MTSYVTSAIAATDAKAGFASGVRALDDYFNRHAAKNDAAGVGRAYVLRRASTEPAEWPAVLGFYTLSMALIESAQAGVVLRQKLPKYPMPVALIGRLAVDARVTKKRLGERLLMDALRRVVDAAAIIGCVGIIVDAKDAGAEAFYSNYDFATVSDEEWPRRMFLALAVAHASFEP